ncbi:hypothetical protein BWI17_01670 [Betaproteobacteria bacterium GR16-43]|nr:hypothetical protein BWI17_01670 [Betaproteobacteria bacterium GR16-43]
MKERVFVLAILIGIGILVLRDLFLRLERGRRAKFIAAYRFPVALVRKYADTHPALDATQVRNVFEGLRQYFLACLAAQRGSIARSVGMPSRAVDDAWHEFILVTRDYQAFCRDAFGAYLHHTPENLMGVSMRDALANTLHQFREPPPGSTPWALVGTVPLLFAMDRELGLADGFHHDADSLDRLEWIRQQLAREHPVLHGGGHASVGSRSNANSGCGGGCGSGSGFGFWSGDGGGGGGADGGGCGGGCGGCGS